ncbi:hypothetical protein [Helicovermis profundi]|uniref:Uncharacterized protein n=1 Tax=Helicovermis profundi TaxID=3065157 RepID=A0AAU9E698_9FIRM|nr:hypothetical protein HLPR_23240 [Clostridia bacterium S502]
MNNNMKICKKIFKVSISLAAIAAISKIYYDLKYYDLTVGIFYIEFDKRDIVLISKKSLMFVARSNESNNIVIDKMQELGWEFIDIYGRGLLFVKNGEEIVLFKKEFFARYSIYEIEGNSNLKEEFRKKSE